MANHTQEVKIKFSAETNAQSFKNLQNEINKIQDTWAKMSDQNPMEPQMRKAKDSAVALEKAMTAAYNPKLSTYNLDVLNQKLKESGTSLKTVLTDFNNIGRTGSSAILSTVNNLTSFNLQLNTTKTLFDKIGEGLMKTFSWSIYSSVVNNLSNGIQNAYGYVKALDSSLNDIRIVTGKSADEMDRFAEKANKAAIALGKGTKDYTNASLIYYQQGLSDTEVAARTNVTLKTANVTAQDTAAVSEQLTAVWNGYKVSAEETELYIDKLAKVAAETAADLEELSTGMSKVASVANLVGVDIDQMNAMLATTISVTRQSAESVGVAYKTILARMTTIQAGGEDEGTNLTSYTEKMYNLGINVLDANNKLRDMGDVIEEVGEKWQDMSREQQIALAQVMAGTRQYNNLAALFDNWDMYKKALEDSATAAGTLNEQQAIYMESTAAHIQQLGTAAEGVYDSLLDTKTINGFVDGLTEALKVTEKIVNGFGGLKGILNTITPMITNLFNKQISQTLVNSFNNLSIGRQNENAINAIFNNVEAVKAQIPNINNIPNLNINEVLDLKGDAARAAKGLVAEDANALINEVQKYVKALEDYSAVLSKANTASEKIVKDLQAQGYSFDEAAIKAKDYYTALSKAVENNGLVIQSNAISTFNENLEYGFKDVKFDKLLGDINLPEKIKGIGNTTRPFVNSLVSDISDTLKQAFREGKNLSEIREIIVNGITNFEGDNISSQAKTRMVKAAGAITDAIVQSIKENLQKNLNEALPSSDIIEELPIQIKEKIEAIQTEIDALDNEDGPELLKEKFKNITQEVEALRKSLEKVTEETAQKTTETLNKIDNSLKASAKSVHLVGENLREAVKNADMKGLIRGLTSLTSAAMSTANMVSSVSNAIKVFNDENASFGDKVFAVVRGLSSLTFTIQSFATAFQVLTEAKGADTIATLLNAAAEDLNAGATKRAAEEKEREAAANKANALVKKSEAATSSINKVTSALGNLLVAGINPMIATIAILVASIAAVGIAIWKEYDKADKALEKSKEKLKELNQLAHDAKNNFNSFKDSVSSLEAMQDELSKLTKGTDDWNKKLEDVQTTIENLIEQFPELRKYATWENGGWTIAEKDLEDFQNQLNQRNEATQLGAQGGYINQLYAERDIADRNIVFNDRSRQFSEYINWRLNDFSIKDDGLMALPAGYSELRYRDTLKTTEEIQEKINQAVEDRNKTDQIYWENILTYKEKTIEIEKEQMELSKQMVDYIVGDKIKETFSGKSEYDTIMKDYVESSFAQSGLSIYNATFKQNKEKFDYMMQPVVKFTGYQGVLQNSVIDEIKTAKSVLTGVPKNQIDVKATSEGFIVSYQDKTESITSGTGYGDLIAQAEQYKWLNNQGINKEDYSNVDEALRNLYEQDNNYINQFSLKYLEQHGFSSEIDNFISNAEEKITSKSGKSLFDLMKISGKDLSLEEFDELSYAIQEVYAKKGPAAIEIFLEKLKTGKVEVKDFMDFDFDENKVASQLSEEVLERMKGLKIDSKDLDRYKIKFGLTAEDEVTDEVANRIMNYIEAQKDLNNIYKDRKRIFENLKTGDRSSDQWIEDMDLLSNAINTYFGVDVNDDTLIQYLDLIGKFLDGDADAANELGDALRGVQNVENFENTKQNFINTLKDLDIQDGEYIDNEIVENLKQYKNILGLSEDKFNEIMTAMGYKKDENGYKKEMKISLIPISEIVESKGYSKVSKKDQDLAAWSNEEMRAKGYEWDEEEQAWMQPIVLHYAVESEVTLNPSTGNQVETYVFDGDNFSDDQIAKALKYNSWAEAENMGYTKEIANGKTYVRREVSAEQYINFATSLMNDGLKEVAIGVGPGQNLLEAIEKFTSLKYPSIEAFEKDWELIDEGNGYKRFRQKYYFEFEGHQAIIDAAAELPEKTDDKKEEIYTKKQEWKDVENKYDYNAQLQKDVDREMQQLKDEMQYMTGPALAQAYDTEIGFLEEKNRLLQESIDLKKEEQKKTNTRLDEIAAKYGVTLERDEKGRVTAESAQKAIDAMNAAGKSAQANVNAAQEAQKNATDENKTKTQNNLTKAQENLSDKQGDLSEFTSGLSEDANYSADIAQSTYEIYKNQQEIIKLDVSKMWAETDDKIKQCKDDISAINTLISELNKDSAYLDFAGQMDNAATTKELREKIKGNIETEQTQLKNGINNMITSDESRFKGMDISAFDLGAIGSNDLMRLYDARTVAKSKLQELTDQYGASADKNRKKELHTEMELWQTIIDKTDNSIDLTSQYNDILRDTKVNLDKVKDATDQINIEAIDNQISKYQKDLDKLQDDASGLTGKKLIDNLNKQLAIQKKIIAEEKKKLPEYKKQTAETEKILTSREEWAKVNAEIKYNEDGSLANYYEIVAAIESAVDLSREQRDKLLEQLDALQKISQEYAKQEETIRKAEKAAKDTAKKIKDEAEKELGKAFEKLNAKVDVEVNIEDAWRQLHKLRAELEGLRDDDYLGNFNLGLQNMNEYLKENINQYSELSGGSTQILTDHLNQIMSEIGIIQSGGTSALYGTDESQAFSDLEKYRGQLQSNVESALSSIKELKQTYLNAIDTMISKNSELLNDLESIKSVSQQLIDTLKLVYGGSYLKYTQPYYAAQTEIAKNGFDIAKQQEAFYKQRLMDTNPDENPEQYEKYKKAWQDAFNNVLKYQKEILQAAKAEYDNFIDSIIQKAKDAQKQMGSVGLSIGMKWDLEQKESDDWVDYTNSLYEINKLQRKINESISDSTSESARQKLLDAQKESIDYLNEQIDKNKKLTKYEIDRANAVYELTLKQIALEEAQENKSQMRLRRDSQGNYRYEYVADQNKIADLEQQVEDAENKIYNLDKEATQKFTNMIESYLTEFGEHLKEIQDNQVMSEEEKQTAIATLYEEYYGPTGYITLLMESANEAQQNMIKTTKDEIDEFLNAAMEATTAYTTSVTEDVATSQEEVQTQLKKTTEDIDAAEASVNNIEKTWSSYIDTASYVAQIDEDIANAFKDQVSQIEALLPYLASLEAQYRSLAESAASAIEASLMLRENYDNDNNTSDQEMTHDENGLVISNQATESGTVPYMVLEDGTVLADADYKPKSAAKQAEVEAKIVNAAGTIKAQKEGIKWTRKFANNMSHTRKGSVSFDTGGYTGEWGEDGRLAILHQKELVLNATDTSNILSAVDIMRQIMQGVSGLQFKAMLNNPQISNTNSGTLEQDVHIEANFPNVVNAEEIEEAFNNLVNLASQKIHNTRR